MEYKYLGKHSLATLVNNILNKFATKNHSHVLVESAEKWATARNLTLSGSVSGSASIDGSADVNIETSMRFDNMLDGLRDLFYPIGISLYFSSDTDPNEIWQGTTWVRDAVGKTVIGYDPDDSDFSTIGKTGGAKTINISHNHTVNNHTHSVGAHTHGLGSHVHSTAAHKLTISEIPSHTHVYGTYTQNVPQGDGYTVTVRNNYGISTTSTTNSTGGNGTHNHGNTGAATGNTNSNSAFNSGGSAPNTDSRLTTNQTIMPPYIVKYMWTRTA